MTLSDNVESLIRRWIAEEARHINKMNEQLTEIVKQLILKKIELKQCAAFIRNVIKQVVMQKFPNKAHEEVCNSVRFYFGRMQDMYNQTVQLLHESIWEGV